MNIVLIGFMGTGKSAVGQVLAQRLGWDYSDTDAEIEREAGETISQIFAREGESPFRARETAVLSALAPQNWGGGASLASPQVDDGQGRGALILSTGGGTPLRDENAALLKQIGTIVWLQASPEAILARVGPDFRSRPLLAEYSDNPGGRIESLLAERAPRYAALADFALDTSNYAGPEEAAEAILALPVFRKE